MKFLFSRLATLLPVLLVLGGCAATLDKDIAAPVIPAHTSAELSADTRSLNDELDVLGRIGLTFEFKSVNGRTIANWKSSSTPEASVSVQVTELERFVDLASKYLTKYWNCTIDGKLEPLPDAAKADLQAQIDLANAKLKAFGDGESTSANSERRTSPSA